MTEATNWPDVKAKARATDPIWDSAERAARREQIRERMIASVSAPNWPRSGSNSG